MIEGFFEVTHVMAYRNISVEICAILKNYGSFSDLINCFPRILLCCTTIYTSKFYNFMQKMIISDPSEILLSTTQPATKDGKIYLTLVPVSQRNGPIRLEEI